MTKKEYFEQVDRIVRDTIATMNFTKAEIETTDEKIRSGMFSDKTIQGELYPEHAKLKNALVAAKEKAIDDIKKLSETFCNEITENNRLKGEELTEDAKLLNVGVKLSGDELEAMFDRNSGNPTMERLVREYAKKNDIRISRVPRFKGKIEFDAAKWMPTMCHYILKNYNSPSMYQEFLGDESQCRAQFMNDAES